MNIDETSIPFEIRKQIMKMNNEQLDCVVQAVQDRRYLINQELKLSFNKGDKVWFRKSVSGEVVNAIIIKRNPKSIQLREVDNKYAIWNVSPSLLKRGEA